MIRMTLRLALLVPILVIAAISASPCHAWGDAIPTEKLIEQLGSNDFAERERAAQALRARGPSVLPALRKARKHGDAEVRRRVEQLISALEIVAALEPRRVTLGPGQRTLADALADIAKQTGYSLAADDPQDSRLRSFAMKNVSFWEALDRLGRQTGRCVSPSRTEEQIRLEPCEGRSPFVALSGPFRLEATHFHEDRDIDFTAPGKGKELGRREHLLTLTVSVLAEPRLILLDVEPAKVELAEDEDRKSLRPAAAVDEERQEVIRRSLFLRRESLYPSDVLLRRSTERAKTVKVLRGTIRVWVVVQRKPVVVSENVLASRGTKRQLGDSAIEVTQAEKDSDGDLNISISVPPKRDALQGSWHARIHVEDARGNRYEANGGGTSSSGDRYEVSRSYPAKQAAGVGPPSKLVVEEWITLHHAIPFEFKDVPLP